MALEILLAVGFNLVPIAVGLIPYILLRGRGAWGSFYLRLLICFSFFWIFYDLVPAVLFQIGGKAPTTLLVSSSVEGVLSVFSYYLILTVDAVFNIFNFLINSWPFVFVGAPLLATLIIMIHLRREKGGLREKFGKIGFEYRENPIEGIRKRLEINSWKDEKSLIKLLIVLLPLSLYLLTGVLSATGGGGDALAPSSELGWFIEVFIVYLLIPITAVHLLYVSKVSYQGKFFGDKIRQSVFYYLISIGAVLSALSIILFIQQNPASISTIIYFVSYYAMSVVIFAVFLPVYETLSSYLLVKISSFIKRPITVVNTDKSRFTENNIYTAVTGTIIFFVILILTFVLSTFWVIASGAGGGFFNQFLFENPSGPSLLEQASLEGNIILSFSLIFIGLLVWSLTSSAFSKIFPSKLYFAVFLSFILSLLITIIILNIDIPFIFSRSSYWVVPAPASIDIYTFTIFTPRTALLQVPSGTIFRFIAYPFDILKALCSAILLSAIIYYWRAPFKVQRTSLGDVNLETIYSRVSFIPGFSSVSGLEYLFKAKEPITTLSSSKKLDETYNILSSSAHTFKELKAKLGFDEGEIYLNLKNLFRHRALGVYKAEFSFIFYQARLKSVYLVSQDGRNLFSHSFSEEQATEPVLVAGMLSAISSFVKETTKSRDLLRSIDHGDTTLLVEYGRYSFAALLADRETTDLRNRLQKYIQEFERTYSEILASWDGDIEPFENERGRIIEFFVE